MPEIVVSLFILGVIAGLVGSELRIPKGAYNTISILLMLAIGLKGGWALHGNLTWALVPELLLVALAGGLIPLLCYPLLRRLVRLDAANSASLAAHYGSVSAGTFAVALAFVANQGLVLAPQTTLYLVLLEMPAIITALVMYRRLVQPSGSTGSARQLMHEVLTSRGVLLLTGGVVIGYVYGIERSASIQPLFQGLFPGLLALFLLEMGLVTAGYLRIWNPAHWRVLVFALCAPPLLATMGGALGLALGLPDGSVLVLAALMGSASYIAAPATIQVAIPEADLGLAMVASLGVTFSFNVLIGIPLGYQVLRWLAG